MCTWNLKLNYYFIDHSWGKFSCRLLSLMSLARNGAICLWNNIALEKRQLEGATLKPQQMQQWKVQTWRKLLRAGYALIFQKNVNGCVRRPTHRCLGAWQKKQWSTFHGKPWEKTAAQSPSFPAMYFGYRRSIQWHYLYLRSCQAPWCLHGCHNFAEETR